MTTYEQAKIYLTKAIQNTATPWEKAALLTYTSRVSNQEKYPSLSKQTKMIRRKLYVPKYDIED